MSKITFNPNSVKAYHDWKAVEYARSHQNMKQVGERMLWALLYGVRVNLNLPNRNEPLTYERILEVRYQIPSKYTESSVSVLLNEGNGRDSVMRTKGELITFENAPPELAVWDKLDMDEPRRLEIFTAMRQASTVIHGGIEYARITGIIFRKDKQNPDRLAVRLEAVTPGDSSTTITAPHTAFEITGHLLNRE